MQIVAKRLLGPTGWQYDRLVTTEHGRIQSIEPVPAGCSAPIAPTLVAGYFDTHNHGGYGFDSCAGTMEELSAYLMDMMRCGITDTLLTVSTGPIEAIQRGLELARKAMILQAHGKLPGTAIRGVHMEGPFLNPQRPGAMTPERMLPLDVELFERHFGDYLDIVRLVTIAPEREGGRELTAYLRKYGITVQAGHTDATFEQAMEAFGFGVQSLCHTFNAARPIHHREPGIVTAALLSDDVYCEVIGDLLHLHSGAVQLIYRMKGADRMVLISDAVNSTGLPDGTYTSANHAVVVKDGVSRTPAGNLSGGSCYLNQTVRKLIGIGISEADVYHMAARTPARRLGMAHTGYLAPGAEDHLLALDEKGEALFTLCNDTCYAGGKVCELQSSM